MSRLPTSLALALLAAGSLAAAPTDTFHFVRIAPAEVVWHDIPGGRGAQVAVLSGDPQQPGPYVMRVKFPPHVMDLPHTHPNARYVTVLQGTWYAGTGTTFDPKLAQPMPAGSFMLHPALAPHWDGSATDDTVIVQIIGEGPGTSTPVDPKQPDWVSVTL